MPAFFENLAHGYAVARLGHISNRRLRYNKYKIRPNQTCRFADLLYSTYVCWTNNNNL